MLFGNTGLKIAAAVVAGFLAGACGAEGEATEDTTAPTLAVVATNATTAELVCPVNPDGVSALDCDGNAANGCEVDPYEDAANCGACGNACGDGFPSCIQKRCCNVQTGECE